MELLAVKDVRAYYRLPSGEQLRAVDGVSLSVAAGEVVGIAGESGSGKSTLAHLLGLTMAPPLHLESGQVLVEGQEIRGLDQETIRQRYRGSYISVVPQGALNALNPSLRIRQFATDVIREHYPEITPAAAVARAKERMEALGLPARVLEAYPHQLSGGMKQRTAIAISTLLNPKVLICDEPTSALDVSSQRSVLDLLRRLLQEQIIQSAIFVTHELPLLNEVADRVVIMYGGKLSETGPARKVIFDPLHPYTRALVGSVLVPEPGMKDRRVEGIAGAPPDLRRPLAGCRFAPRCDRRMERCQEEPMETTLEGRQVWCWLHEPSR